MLPLSAVHNNLKYLNLRAFLQHNPYLVSTRHLNCIHQRSVFKSCATDFCLSEPCMCVHLLEPMDPASFAQDFEAVDFTKIWILASIVF